MNTNNNQNDIPMNKILNRQAIADDIKKLLFLLLFPIVASSQCITVNSAFFTNPSNDGVHWSLNVNWTALRAGNKAANPVIRITTKAVQKKSQNSILIG